ncbi:hypothetical protein BCV69DRAFT_44458 [Microstroma glucosiphilum]|uniref:Fungal-type protein kinase domain-containing protein n=1 Tax=Pseudomicrostroma glucosiphilum TaxID=1684307 RepID=A0A316U1M7_9BASI|nr:hypothetical protein BCV69DRAFT_44458 [Pseudomicrostroma glucosiphilum]PWN19100.1 hypothetical protein BCV69DRAFT_44458 [Pseudomicrostroma glucosiphilum]
MSETISGKRSQKEPEAVPSTSTDSRPDYTFSFRPVQVTASPKKRYDMSLVPDALIDTLLEQRGLTPEVGPSVSMRSTTPETTSSPAARETITEGAPQMELDIKRDATNFRYPGIYEMYTNATVDASAKAVMASSQVRGAFRLLNEDLDEGKRESVLVKNICDLSASVRRELGAEGSDYGEVTALEKYRMRKPLSMIQGQVRANVVIDKVDIVIPRSKKAMAIKTVPSDPLEATIECCWSNALSFIEAKVEKACDLRDELSLQCLRYTIFQYQAPCSHVHFVTWCANLVRLWVVNASLYGCSRGFDTRDPEDQLEIVKILRFVNLEQYSTQLCGHWDVKTIKQLSLEPDTVAPGNPLCINLAGHLQDLNVRPGPFRTRTAVLVEQTEAAQKHMLKVSWQDPHLRLHELAMMRGVASFSDESKLPYAAVPLGLALIEPHDFQTDNSAPLEKIGTLPPHFTTRVVCALVYKHHLGDLIGRQVLPHDLVHIHVELARQLLSLAKHGYHYRDLNEGNVRLLRGSINTLLLIDLGNVRRDLSPRGKSGSTDAEAIIERARDDTRSANEYFLPTCFVDAKKAIKKWNSEVTRSKVVFKSAVDSDASDGLQLGLLRVSERLSDLHQALRSQAKYSHRYIDDLESATYQHFWRVSAPCLPINCSSLELIHSPSTFLRMSLVAADGSQR